MSEGTSVKAEVQLIDKRLARMESRLVKLMIHLGADPYDTSGKPEQQGDPRCKTSTPLIQSKRSN